jgi:hypothetical protein
MAYDLPPIYSVEQIDAMTERQHKTYETRCRRAADRQGLQLEKSRARDENAIDFGTYRLVDQRSGAVAMRAWDLPGSFGANLGDIASYLFARQIREDDEARRLAKVYPFSVDISIMKITVNNIPIVATSERLDRDLRAMGLGKTNLDKMLADIAQRATPVSGNPLVYESTVASRLGGAPRRVVIEQFGRNASRMDYATGNN